MSQRRRPLFLAALLVAMTAAAYLPAARGGYVWDDDVYVEHNPTLTEDGGLRRIWLEIDATPQYYPLVHTAFWLEHRLWGDDPAGYHWINILLHALSAVLLWRILVLLEIRGAWAAAAIFALHPVHVESVAWITERKNVLSGVFYLASALAYLRWALAEEKRSPRLYALSLLLFLGALLSKTVAASLPAALLLLLWWKRGRITWYDLRPTVPFFALGAGFGLLTAWIEKHYVGAAGNPWDLSLIDRCLIAGRALWFYLGKLLWPARLTFIYPRWEIEVTAWQLLFPAAATSAVLALWLLRRRLGRGPLVAVLFFAGTLSPALGFFDVYPMQYSFVADHFQYLASLGPIVLAAAAGARLAGRLPRRHGVAVLAAVLLILGVLTWRQGQVYRDEETLWRDTLAKNPAAWMAHNNLGMLLQSRGELGEAARHYRRAIEIKPDYAYAHNNLGTAVEPQDRPAAIGHFRSALELDPDYAKAHYNLGSALAAAGRTAEAEEHFRRAVELEPEHASAHNNLANLLAAQGRLAEAIDHYERSLELRPDAPRTRYNLGTALIFSRRAAEAVPHLLAAASAAPDGWTLLARSAWILAAHPDPAIRDGARAVTVAEAAAEAAPAEAAVLDVLAAAYAAADRFAEAVATTESALELAHGDEPREQELRRRIEMYRQGKVLVDPGLAPAGGS
jgi:Tfp pilus assembly protein PilF